jgi:deazaflavin-dependent oxidoreductase (nitroreductase family)
MWGWIGMAVVGLLVVGLGLWVALVVSMRTKHRRGLTAIRRLNRRFTNPRVMRTAGEPGAAASVIRHVGRATGTPYETPIGVIETDDGFVIVLPYGASTDWVKNVQAAGSAVIDTEGRAFRVASPKVVRSADVDRYFSSKERLTHRIYRVDQFLVLQRVSAGVPTGADR